VELIPAIDLLDGKVVRLARGVYGDVTDYDDDPVAIALRWQEQGATRLHIVDLDAARSGKPQQAQAIEAIVRASALVCQVAGGIRTAADAAAALDAGADRVVLGSAFVSDPSLATTLVEAHGVDRIVAALDVRDGRALGDGWVEAARGTDATSLGVRLRSNGVVRFAVTAIARDGLMTGPDLELLASMSDALPGAAIIASAGISSTSDIAALAAAGYESAILGRALYEEAFTLSEAMAAAQLA
jgi:phosphoribosylformimino-5-aminoimidazole carboxamide ribotide isomerase